VRPALFEWDDHNEEHVARHGVDPSEAEEVIRGRHVPARATGDLRLAWGVTAAGRHLLVVWKKSEGWIRVITGRDMSAREKVRFRRRMKR
jgi:hypothetical protein